MHPLGSIGILQAAAAGGGGGGGGGSRPSLICFSPVTLSPLLHCLAITPTPLTPTNILKYRAKSHRWYLFFSFRGRNLPVPSSCRRIAVLSSPSLRRRGYFPPPRWAGWTYLSIYQTD